MGRLFANGRGDRGSIPGRLIPRLKKIPGRVIPRLQKMVLDISLLNAQHNNVRIKGRV